MFDNQNRYFDPGAFTGEGVYDADAYNFNRDTSIAEPQPGERYYALYSFTYRGRLIRKALKSRTYNRRELEVLAGQQCAVYHEEKDLDNCVCKKMPPGFEDVAIPQMAPLDMQVVAPAPEQVAPLPEELPLETPTQEDLLSRVPVAPTPPEIITNEPEVEIPAEPAPAPKKRKKKSKKAARPEIQYAKGVFAELKNGIFPLFKGRTCRREYWIGMMLVTLPTAFLIFLGAIPKAGIFIMSALLGVYSLVAFIISLSTVMKRMRDMNKPTALAFLLFVPLANLIVVLMAAFVKGVDGENEHGPDHRQFYSDSGIGKGIVILIITTIVSALAAFVCSAAILSYVMTMVPGLTVSPEMQKLFGLPAQEEETFDWGDEGTGEEETHDWGDEGTGEVDTFEDAWSEDTSTTEEPTESTYENDWMDPDSAEQSPDWDWESTAEETENAEGATTDEGVTSDENFDEFAGEDFLGGEDFSEDSESIDNITQDTDVNITEDTDAGIE